MNKRMLSMITALTVATGIFGTAAADTIPANMGKAAIGSQTNLFNYNPFTGAVTSTGVARWELGLPLDIFGPKVVTVTSRATTPGAAWRVVAANAIGTMFTASLPAPILVSAVALPATRAVFVPPGGVCFIDALMNNGSSIVTVNYNM